MKKNTNITLNGAMSKKGADMTGRIYAISALIASIGIAVGVVIIAISKLITVLQ